MRIPEDAVRSGSLPTHLRGRGTGPRLVLVHGFTQAATCWGAFAPAFETSHHVVAVDLPGHGDAAGIVASFPQTVDLVADAGGTGCYLGYSMGARVCLAVALAHPERVQHLVLLSGSAGLRDPAERAARRDADDALAARLEGMGIDAFLDEWLAGPLFETLSPIDAGLEQRRSNTAAGLSSSLRTCGTGQQPDLWPRLTELRVPVLVVTGALDARYGSIGEEMVQAIGPTARHVVIDGAGHAVHLERPDATARAVHEWLDTARPHRAT